MMDIEKIAIALEFSIRGYLFGMGEATPVELKKDLKKILSPSSKLESDFIDRLFEKILDRKLREMASEE